MDDTKHRIIVTGSDSKVKEPPKISTADECLNYLDERLALLIQKRMACDVEVPGDNETKVRYQQRSERQYLMHLGGLLHMLGYALARRDISQNAYEEMHSKALSTLVPTIVGIV